MGNEGRMGNNDQMGNKGLESNPSRRRTSWVLLGALGLAGATALAVFTLERSPPAPPPVRTAGTPTTASGPEDPRQGPLDSQRVPDTGTSVPETHGSASSPPAPLPGAIPGMIRGEVVASSGRPIAGAEIRLALVEPEEARDLESATCDAAGQFAVPAQVLDQLDPGRRGLARLVATARAPGFQTQRQEIQLRLMAFEGAAPLYFKFRLAAGNTLAGRVVDRAGNPVRGAEVELLVPGAAAKAGEKSGVRAQKNVYSRDRTRSDGRFVLNFVSSGAYQLSAREPNTGTAFQEKLDLAANADHTLKDVVLMGDGILAGHARYPGGAPAGLLELWAIPDWMAGEPNALATATLKAGELERDDGLLYGRTTSDSAGHFRFAGLKSGNYAIRAPREATVLEPRQARYVLGTENIAIEVQSNRLIVHVKDAGGRPLPGANVACAEMSLVQDGRLETVKVDHAQASGASASATFDVDSDRTFALTASAPGCLAAEDLVILAPGEYELQRDLVLQPSGAKGRLHLTLEGTGNQSISALEVAFLSALTEQRSEAIGVLSPDAQGWLPALPPGRYRLQVGFGAERGELSMYFPIPTREEVEIRAGASTEHIVRARPGARVRLTLDVGGGTQPTPPLGASSENQRERYLRENGAVVAVACGAAGEKRTVQFVEPAPEHPQRFLLESWLAPGQSALIYDLLEPGDCTLYVEAPGFQSVGTPVRLRPGEIQDVRIALRRK